MHNDDKVTPDAHLIYITKLTPLQLAKQLRNSISVPNESETFLEALKSGFHFKGTVSENSFHITTKDNHEYAIKGKFFEESDYTKIEVVFEYDNLISKKWRKILLIVTGVLLIGLGLFSFLTKKNLWVLLFMVGAVFFTLIFPNHKEKHLISSYKKRLEKLLMAYEFIEK
jgi:hypothetical protein